MGKIQFGEPGRYDGEASHLLRSTTARACIVIVIGGYKGDGCSVSSRPSAIEFHEPANVAKTLREHADYIEKQGGYAGLAGEYHFEKPKGSA